MSGHTPGPWTYKATAGNHDFAVYSETSGRDIALVRNFDETNARLIAKAPELVAALEAAEIALTNMVQVFSRQALPDPARAKLQILRDRHRGLLAEIMEEEFP